MIRIKSKELTTLESISHDTGIAYQILKQQWKIDAPGGGLYNLRSRLWPNNDDDVEIHTVYY